MKDEEKALPLYNNGTLADEDYLLGATAGKLLKVVIHF